MTFIRTDRDQSNLVDGTIYAYDVRPDGMYVTVKGNDPDGTPLILSFDGEDIEGLRHAIALFSGAGNMSLYVEPTELASGLAVGLGTDAGERERTVVYFNGGEVHLDPERTADLIVALTHNLAAMGLDMPGDSDRDVLPVNEFPVDSEVFHLDGATIIGRENYEAELVRRAFQGGDPA